MVRWVAWMGLVALGATGTAALAATGSTGDTGSPPDTGTTAPSTSTFGGSDVPCTDCQSLTEYVGDPGGSACDQGCATGGRPLGTAAVFAPLAVVAVARRRRI